MTILEIPCRRDNYGGLRGQDVQYLVIHYTAVCGDTAENEGKYFARQAVGASAHYFVDENTVVRSVPEAYTAWHCGGAVYRHPKCRNSNSIGIEICTKGENGHYWFAPRALARAKCLIRELMTRYGISPENIVRHYDVTGKICPAPFVGEGQGAWETFKGGFNVYQHPEEVPVWARPTVEKLVQRGILQGTGEGLALTEDLVRTLVILDRAGVFGKENTYDNQAQ